MSPPLKHSGHEAVPPGDEGSHRDNARARKNTAVSALAGAETVPALTDSLGNAIASVSPLTMQEREAAKKRLQKGN